MRIVCKLTSPGLLCASLAGLTGCATTAELEDLRAEVAKANELAARAAADLEKTQRELASLKAEQVAVESPSTSYGQRRSSPESASRSTGYKWGRKDS